MTVVAQSIHYGKLPVGDFYPGYLQGSQDTVQAGLKAQMRQAARVRKARRQKDAAGKVIGATDKAYISAADKATLKGWGCDIDQLPDHMLPWEQKSFPPIFSQGGYGSCGVTSHVGYMMTNEMNAAQGTDASKLENQLCPMFQYPFTYHGPGKDEMGIYVGYPTADIWGGRYPGSIFGAAEYTSGVCGWMQGYDRWHSTMQHRIASADNFRNPNGQKVSTAPGLPGFWYIKGYIYNHNGDPAFHNNNGVLCMGCGISSSAHGRIPATQTNKNIGVSGQAYMAHWNFGGADHAITLAGYDDRVEFDLDGNGIAGEPCNSQGQDERGAWIIANTWGGWANGGFIYVPYAQAGGQSYNKDIPALADAQGNLFSSVASGMTIDSLQKLGATFQYNGDTIQSVTYNGVTYTYSSTVTTKWYPQKYYWENYQYKYRAGYTPLRTMKVTMEYVHRSEISVVVGVAQDTAATQPEKTSVFRYINYQGDGTSKDPATPLLGQWSDGTMHYEPMEFGVDLTDLTTGLDNRKPLKYFLIINSNADTAKAKGHGQIISASVIDYEFDDRGVETPFPQKNTTIHNGGAQTVISVIVGAEPLNAPRNAVISGNTMSWDAPADNYHSSELAKYNIYNNGVLADSVVKAKDATALATSKAIASTAGNWTVRAVYAINGKQYLSAASNVAMATTNYTAEETDSIYDKNVLHLTNGGFYIPDVVSSAHNQYTVEFWFKPTNLRDNNSDLFFNQTWGSRYMMQFKKDGSIIAGWRLAPKDSIVTKPGVVENNKWSHIALVIDGKKHTLYVNGEKAAEATSTRNTGFPSFWSGRLYIGDRASINGYIDEMRLWTTARSGADIASNMRSPILNPSQVAGLAAYFRGDVYKQQYSDNNGLTQYRWRVKDSAHGNDGYFFDPVDSVKLHQETLTTDETISKTSATPTVSILGADSAYVGEPVTYSASGSVSIVGYQWATNDTPAATTTADKPSFVFSTPGEKQITLTATDLGGKTATASMKVKVLNPQVNAAITLSADTVSTGEVISFISANRAPNCSYKWCWAQEDANAANADSVSTFANASTVFDTEGVKTVKLTVTTKDGQTYTSSRQFVVTLTAPVEDHEVVPITVLKGDTVSLIDKSKPTPDVTHYWNFLSTSSFLQMDSISGHIYPANSGVYSLTRIVANKAGSTTTTSARALIVCNDESVNGLSFYGKNSQTMKLTLPTAQSAAWSMEFWLNPTELSAQCVTIKAENGSALTLQSNAVGDLTLTTGNQTRTIQKLYAEGQWHHYAFSASGNTITVYRDAQQVGTLAGTYTDYSNVFKNITIGGDNSSFAMDEFRVWNKAIGTDDIKRLANQRVDTAKMDSLKQAGLMVYYNFDTKELADGQLNVADQSGNKTNATLAGFDQTYSYIGSSKGVFCLDLNTPANETLIGEELPQQRFKVISWSDSHPGEGSPSNVLDGNVSTYWHTQYQSGNIAYVGFPHSLTFERIGTDSIKSMQFAFPSSRGDDYRPAYVSIDQSDDSTTWENVEVMHHLFSFQQQNIALHTPITKKFIRVTFNTGHGRFLAIGEVRFFGDLNYLTDLSAANGVYTIISQETTRGALYAKPFEDAYASTCGGSISGAANPSIAVDENDPYQQWTFVKRDGKYYLCNVGDHKFMNYVSGNSATMEKGRAAEVTLTPQDAGSKYVILQLGASGNAAKVSLTGKTAPTYLTAADIRSRYAGLRIAILGLTTTGSHYISGTTHTAPVSSGTLAAATAPTEDDILLLESAGNDRFYLKREADNKYFSVAAGSNIVLTDNKSDATPFNIYGSGDSGFGTITGYDDLYSDINKADNSQMVRFVANGQYLNTQGTGDVGGLRPGTGGWSFQYVREVKSSTNGCEMTTADASPVSLLRLKEVPQAVWTAADTEQALQQLADSTKVPDRTVTYQVYVENHGDNGIVDQYTEQRTLVNRAWLQNRVYPAKIASAVHDYMTASVPQAQVNSDTTLVALTYNGPVKFSKDFEHATWYRLSFANNNNGIALNPDHLTSYTQQENGYGFVSNDWDRYADSALWAFSGTPYSLRVWNKGAGEGHELQYHSDNATRVTVAEDAAASDTLGTWEMHKSSNNGGFSLNNKGAASANIYLNNRGMSLGYWDHENARSEIGSRLFATPSSYPKGVFKDLVAENDTMLWGQASAGTNDGTNLDTLIARYDAAPSETTFKAVLSSLSGYRFAVDRQVLNASHFRGSEGWVNVYDSLGAVSLTFGGANDAAYARKLDRDNVSELWRVQSRSLGHVCLQNANTGRWIAEAAEGATTMPLTADSAKAAQLAIIWNTTGDTRTFLLANSDSTAWVHTNTATADSAAVTLGERLQATTWAFEKVTRTHATLNRIGDNNYASSYLPYAVKVKGANVFVPSGLNADRSMLTLAPVDTGTVIPAYTPMVIIARPTSRQATFLIDGSGDTGADIDDDGFYVVVDAMTTVTNSEDIGWAKGAPAGDATADATAIDVPTWFKGTTVPISWNPEDLSLGRRTDPQTKQVSAGFYRYTTMKKLNANRIYIDTSEMGGAAAKGLTIRLDGGVVTIINPMGVTDNEGEETIYNLQGQKLSQPRHGVNIVNGKKVVVK